MVDVFVLAQILIVSKTEEEAFGIIFSQIPADPRIIEEITVFRQQLLN